MSENNAYPVCKRRPQDGHDSYCTPERRETEEAVRREATPKKRCRRPQPLMCRECGDTCRANLVVDKSSPRGRKRICKICWEEYKAKWRTETPTGKASHAAYLARQKAKGPQKRTRTLPVDPLHADIGRRVHDWRKANGVKAAALAALLKVDQSTICRREKGQGRWRMTELPILERLGVQIWDEVAS